MCGLIFVARNDGISANGMVAKRYNNQKSRGSEGFGYVSIKQGKLADYQRSETAKEIESVLTKDTSSAILFHHRMPTSTINHKDASHPILVSRKEWTHDYYVAHNGIISNSDEMKLQHEAQGFKYTTEIVKKTFTLTAWWRNESFNDSEALAVELAKAIETGMDNITIDGSIAVLVLQVEKESKNAVLFYGRNGGNPLVVERAKNFLAVKSEGSGESIVVDMLYSINLTTGAEAVKPFEFGKYKYSGLWSDDLIGYRSETEETDEVDYITLLEEQDRLAKELQLAEVAQNEEKIIAIQNDLYEIATWIEDYELEQAESYQNEAKHKTYAKLPF